MSIYTVGFPRGCISCYKEVKKLKTEFNCDEPDDQT